MNICVLVKQVPGSDAHFAITADGAWIQEAELPFEMNESDNYALEEALQIREQNGDGEVVVVSLGPDRSQKTIREALAKGADRALHIKEEPPYHSDPYAIASAIANAIKAENFDLVLSGLQSDDLGFGQTGVILGELLGMTTATLVVGTEIQDGKIRVKRELEAGWFQWQTMELPASLAIQSGLNTPRYPSLKGIMTAKKKEIKTVSLAEVFADDNLQEFNGLSVQHVEKQTEMIEGSVDQVVNRLVDVFKNEIRIN
ncbi:MAG: electron transfer flavoprotein subunit beta [Candidatus Marinimicrobia bacterium]|jgi:electron transfer flavoprotein beta subunit|nr:electron transfer flavoprotein subunit beta [Candidatus Neomarinimicrobiota bacterium]